MGDPQKDPRAALSAARRVVVKIGSRALVGDGSGVPGRFEALAQDVAALRAGGREVVLVSSGAVAMGVKRLSMSGRPQSTPALQAAAAVGQSRLLQAYESAFSSHGLAVAQVLLTHAGLSDRTRYLNARSAIDALLALPTVPVINENDTVSTAEIEFGDNDQLASMVAPLVGADVLVLLTDVAGVLDGDQQRISVVDDPATLEGVVWSEPSSVSLGGMEAKVAAATRALQRGLPVVIAPAAEPGVLQRIVDGEDLGTLFLPRGTPMASRKYWIAHTLRPSGTLTVDDGAVRAITQNNRSLLPAGLRATEGDYRSGDCVTICAAGGTELARGLVRYDAREVEKLLGARSEEIAERLGRYGGDEIVHRDDLVVLA